MPVLFRQDRSCMPCLSVQYTQHKHRIMCVVPVPPISCYKLWGLPVSSASCLVSFVTPVCDCPHLSVYSTITYIESLVKDNYRRWRPTTTPTPKQQILARLTIRSLNLEHVHVGLVLVALSLVEIIGCKHDLCNMDSYDRFDQDEASLHTLAVRAAFVRTK